MINLERMHNLVWVIPKSDIFNWLNERCNAYQACARTSNVAHKVEPGVVI